MKNFNWVRNLHYPSTARDLSLDMSHRGPLGATQENLIKINSSSHIGMEQSKSDRERKDPGEHGNTKFSEYIQKQKKYSVHQIRISPAQSNFKSPFSERLQMLISKEKGPESHRPLGQGQGHPESLAHQNPKVNPKLPDPTIDSLGQEKVLGTPQEDYLKSLCKARKANSQIRYTGEFLN
jgi:hypothetical protein